DGTMTMVYRVEPFINRKHGEHCIGQKAGCFTRDHVLREFGSGVYTFYVKDVNGKQLYKETKSFSNRDFPPNIDPLELIATDPRNRVYLEMYKKSNAGNPSPEAVKGDDIAAILRAHGEGSKLDPQIVTWLQNMADHRDTLAERLAEGPAKNPAGDLASLVEAISKLQLQTVQPSLDPLALVDRVLAIQNRSETDIDKIWK